MGNGKNERRKPSPIQILHGALLLKLAHLVDDESIGDKIVEAIPVKWQDSICEVSVLIKQNNAIRSWRERAIAEAWKDHQVKTAIWELERAAIAAMDDPLIRKLWESWWNEVGEARYKRR